MKMLVLSNSIVTDKVLPSSYSTAAFQRPDEDIL